MSSEMNELLGDAFRDDDDEELLDDEDSRDDWEARVDGKDVTADRTSLILLPQITLTGLLDAVQGLDVPDFIAKTRNLFSSYSPPSEDPVSDLISGLHDVDFDQGTSVGEWLAPYLRVGVSREWCRLIINLQVLGQPGTSVLVHPDVGERANYVAKQGPDGWILGPARLGRRSVILRPKTRVLGLSLPRRPGSYEEGRVPPLAMPLEDRLDELVDAVAARIRPTVGGEKYLEPDPQGRALAVLAATVAAVLSHSSSRRWRGRQIVVRADVYRRTFEALGLGEYFETARRILELDHFFHLPVQAPWPPGEGRSPEAIGILRHKEGFLTLHPRASLQLGGERRRGSRGG